MGAPPDALALNRSRAHHLNQLGDILRAGEARSAGGRSAPKSTLAHTSGSAATDGPGSGMQPIGNIWSKFPRVVRDIATKQIAALLDEAE